MLIPDESVRENTRYCQIRPSDGSAMLSVTGISRDSRGVGGGLYVENRTYQDDALPLV